MNTPLISIIIPTYNRAQLIKETLDSILGQTYANWECIIVDDGSTDTTLVTLENYCNKDSRFQFYSRPKNRVKGANACRNYGYSKSKGEFIQWFDSDDIMHTNHLEEKMKVFEQNPNLDFVVCNYKTFLVDFNEANIS